MTGRLTDEQLREVARSFTEESIEAAAVNEALALRARNAQLEAALNTFVAATEAAHLRVAKLETALAAPSYDLVMKIESKIRELAVRDQQDVRVFATELANTAIAALKDAPQ